MDHHEAHGGADDVSASGAAGDATEPPREAAVEAGRLLFARPCGFLRGVASLDQLLPADLPEVAFAGRSNVGKSSLVNALTGRSDLARTSNTPGRTQEINLFDLGGRLRLVDLPGYGYARAPKDRVQAWTALVFDYLRGRPNLRLVCVLIDARHGPLKADQDAMGQLAAAAVPFQLVLTKADLVRPAALQALREDLGRDLTRRPAALREPVVTSARKGAGIAELRAILAAHARPAALEGAC
jgi:GTP-binding protein